MAIEFRKRACQVVHRLTKVNFLAMLGNPPEPGEEFSNSVTRAFFEKISDEDWIITSFNPETRDVCVIVTSDNGTRTISVTLPVLSVSKPSNNF
jgi:hypothetical protein